ncbi:MAG: glycosyltransferase [Patescibacteria group bacterium]
MKIAVLTNDYPPARGGAGVIAEVQVKELERRGHEVKVFFHAPTFTTQPPLRRLIAHVGDLRANPKLVEEILAFKPDVLLSHNVTGCGIGTACVIKFQGIRWVHVLHDVQLVEPSGRIITGERFGFFRNVWRLGWARMRSVVFGSPNSVVSPTRWLLEFHRSYGLFLSSKTEIIPNPISFSSAAVSPWAEREPSILYVGRVDVDKGIDVLLRAWKALGDARPRLDIVGDGQRRFGIESMHDGRAIIHGPLPHDRIRSLMAKSRVVVVPSLVTENQPTVALEGLAAGCNVVATNVGGIPETIGKAGRVVKAGSVDELTAALRDALVSSPDDTASQEVLRSHQLEPVVDALEAVLSSNL